ncbi:MAG: DUF6036 family nucleotidyltransferase [Verrucomicrobiaceae bacterium]
MSEAERLIIFGSASLLASFPKLGEESGSPIESTFDADIIPFPFEEDLGEMLHEAFGDGRKFHQRFGYHADIIRPKIAENFPQNWEDRLVPLPGVERVYCLDPHDMAATKCRVARPKDTRQMEWLIKRKLLDLKIIRDRLREIPLDVTDLVQGHALLDLLDKNSLE